MVTTVGEVKSVSRLPSPRHAVGLVIRLLCVLNPEGVSLICLVFLLLLLVVMVHRLHISHQLRPDTKSRKLNAHGLRHVSGSLRSSTAVLQ